MNRKQISSNLQMKIRQYLRFIWQEELTQNVEFENAIIEKLSKSLKEELFLEANGSILNKYSMFFANFSENMLRTLMHKKKNKEIRFNPENLIFSQNYPDDGEIYFIMKGKVEIFVERFPEDYEKYCLMRDQILVDNNFNSLNTSCYNCKSFDHLIKDCPLFHFSFHSKNKCLINSIQNSRKQFKRKNLKKPNSLKNLTINLLNTHKLRKNSEVQKIYNLSTVSKGLDEFTVEEKKYSRREKIKF